MTRRSGVAAALVLLLLAGPLGLLELDHADLHAHAADSDHSDHEASDHPDCPVCFAAKEPVSLALPQAPFAPAESERPVDPIVVGRIESSDLVRSTPPRGPPSFS
ncbi:MAG TPA: hypothetical protein VKU85_15355 [bacterium]|nr:hypothetical protein [bacterium]